jgi:hypothetical protein
MTEGRDAWWGAAADIAFWLAAMAALFAASFAIRDALTTPLRLLLSEPLQMLALFALATWRLRRRGERWTDLGLKAPASAWRAVGLAAAGVLAVYATGAVVLFAVLRPLGLAAPNVGVMAELMKAPVGYPAIMALTWTTVAFGEEMQFRGFLFSRLERLFGGGRPATIAAWLAQGLMFGGLHGYQGVAGVVTTATVGLVIGAVYLVGRRNLIPCVLLHGFVDTLSLTAIFYLTSHGLKLPA